MVSTNIVGIESAKTTIGIRTSAKKKEVSDSFETMFETRRNNSFENERNVKRDSGKEKISNNNDTNVYEANNSDIRTNSNAKDDFKDVIENKDISDEVNEDIKEVIDKDDDELSKEMENTVQILFQSIIQIISENSGISSNEVTDAMQELNINGSDILNSNSVNDIIAYLKADGNVMNLLTDSNLSDMVKNILSDINELKNDFLNSSELNIDDINSLMKELDFDEMLLEQTNQTNDVLNQNDLPSSEKNISYDEEKIIATINNAALSDKTDDILEDGEMTNNVDTTDSESINNLDNQSSEDDIFQEKEENSNSNEYVKTKTTNSDGDSSRDETKGLPANQITNVFENVRQAVITTVTTQNGEFSTAERIISQIIDGIKTNVNSTFTTMTLQLEPENLGKINISIMSKGGNITAQIVAQNELAKEAIESQLNVLKDNFENQGLKVDAVEVTVASQNFNQNLKDNDETSDKQKTKGKKHLSAKDLTDINENESETDEMVQNRQNEILTDGNTVSYLV